MTNLSIQRPATDSMAAMPRAMAPVAVATSSVTPSNAGAIKQDAVQPTPQVAKRALSSDELKNLASEIQRKVSAVSSDLQFSVDEETGKDLIRVTDRTTKKIVWQFPSEEALNITKALDQYQKGVMLNRKV
jgi:flagellar protein FlaG